MAIYIDILVTIALVLLKTFANSISIISTFTYTIAITKLSIVIILNLTKSFAKQLLLNRTIIYNFENNTTLYFEKNCKILSYSLKRKEIYQAF